MKDSLPRSVKSVLQTDTITNEKTASFQTIWQTDLSTANFQSKLSPYPTPIKTVSLPTKLYDKFLQ